MVLVSKDDLQTYRRNTSYFINEFYRTWMLRIGIKVVQYE